MNKDSNKSGYSLLETLLKMPNENHVLYRLSNYDNNIHAWMAFGGDNEQFTTLKNLEWCKKLDKLIEGGFEKE